MDIRNQALAVRDKMLAEGKYPKLEKFFYYDLIIDVIELKDKKMIMAKWQKHNHRKPFNPQIIDAIISYCGIMIKGWI